MVGGENAAVIGAGIAGASVAYFLSKAGFAVTVMDAGVHTASHVPSALINPVRGQAGQVDEWATEGMHFTWNLIRELTAQGHHIPHGQSGVLRPLPDDRTRATFGRNLPAHLKTEWLSPADSPEPLAPGWAHVLRLPDAGWVDGKAFCEALLTASRAEIIQGRAETWEGNFRVPPLPTGRFPLKVFCGGSVGSTWAGETATHRMGSVLRLNQAPASQPLSFGAYVSPAVGSAAGAGGVLGGTFETPSALWQEPRLPLASLGWLLDKGEALTNLGGVSVTGVWTGSRLSGLQAGRETDGSWRLTGLSSKGFLLGPLLAFRLVQEIAASRPVPYRPISRSGS